MSSKDEMLGRIMRVLVTIPDRYGILYDLVEKLASESGPKGEWVENLGKFLRKESCWSSNRAGLLELISTVAVPATLGMFVAREKFVCDTDDTAKVKIIHLDSIFTKLFLSGCRSRVEYPISGHILHFSNLRRTSMNNRIISELGGEEKSETSLMEIFFLMEKQGDGEDGALLNNEHGTNIFYVRTADGILVAVDVGWQKIGWHVRATPTMSIDTWDNGCRVFSRNPIPGF